MESSEGSTNLENKLEKKSECMWNRAIDTVKSELNKYGLTKEYSPNELITESVNVVKNHETTKGLFSFFSNAANKNDLQISLFGHNLNITYQDRRNFVLLFSTGMFFYHFKPMRKFVKAYVLLSLLVCRENFNLNNYKF
jgi:hypothetical protein